jgi:hypothetical protein
MVKENMMVKKTRYICVSIGDMEVYIEDIPATGAMIDHLPAARLRLREIQKVMPLGQWSVRIEQQWSEKGTRHYQWLDAATGELHQRKG